jgi:hypothetical protein
MENCCILVVLALNLFSQQLLIEMKVSMITAIIHCILFASSILPFASGNDHLGGGCENPLNAVLDILQCISEGDVACASLGYNTGEFKKIHNGKDTGTVINGESYWSFVLSLVKLDFSYDHMVNIGHNMASIRYIEKVLFTDGTAFELPASNDYPWSTEIEQHEHVLVTVDDGCKIKTWNQYGDNTEQKAVDDVANDVIMEFCSQDILSPERCAVLLPTYTAQSFTRAKKAKASKKQKKDSTRTASSCRDK